MGRNVSGDGILEQGNIYFLYRPKVDKERARNRNEVERFYVVLSPEGKKLYREIIIGQKMLPKIRNGGERNWGFVKMVTSDPHDLEQEFGQITYDTKTRGKRELAPARPAGEGVYAIVRHGGHTHLAYSLELPEKPREVQRELRIEDEGSYIFSVKNPEKSSPSRVGLSDEQKAEYPQKLKDVFAGRRFADADPPDPLDFPGAEIMLIGAREDPAEELEIGMHPEQETESTADVFRDLKLNRRKHPTRPLFQGKWE